MTLRVAETPANPRLATDWQFSIHIPGWPRAKGSQETRYYRKNGRTVAQLVEKDIVLRWVATASAYAMQERMKRQAHGDRTFPYEGPVKLTCTFVYERPATQPTGPPITKSGVYAVGDLDKLLRAVGDALAQGTFTLNREKIAKAGVLYDDCLITQIVARKAFCDEVGMLAGAHLILRNV